MTVARESLSRRSITRKTLARSKGAPAVADGAFGSTVCERAHSRAKEYRPRARRRAGGCGAGRCLRAKGGQRNGATTTAREATAPAAVPATHGSGSRAEGAESGRMAQRVARRERKRPRRGPAEGADSERTQPSQKDREETREQQKRKRKPGTPRDPVPCLRKPRERVSRCLRAPCSVSACCLRTLCESPRTRRPRPANAAVRSPVPFVANVRAFAPTHKKTSRGTSGTPGREGTTQCPNKPYTW